MRLALTIRCAIGKFSEALTGRCVLETLSYVFIFFCIVARIVAKPLSGVVLEKVCEYFLYNEKHKDQVNVPDMDIPPELCLELLMAADYLDT